MTFRIVGHLRLSTDWLIVLALLKTTWIYTYSIIPPGLVVLEAFSCFQGLLYDLTTFNCSSFLNCDIRTQHRGQGPFWYERVCCFPPLPLKMDAGEMLISPGHEAGRVHSSKSGPVAAEPQSGSLNLFCSEALQLPKADASVETPSLPLSLHALYI